MINKRKKLVVTFYTSNMAFAMEKVCKAEKIDGELISTPRSLSSDCGISFATDVDNENDIKEIIEKNRIEFDKISVV